MKALRWIALFLGAALAGFFLGEGALRISSGRKMLVQMLAPAQAKAFVRQENLREATQDEVVPNEEIERELNLLRDQFADDNVFSQALGFSGFTAVSLRESLVSHLRARRWLEKQIASELAVDPAEERRFFDANPAQFAQPPRFRVSHIFLAAPDGSPDEVIAAKRSEIQGLSVRILAGEKFQDFVAEASEDEASKSHGGDLNYFSAQHMPAEFMVELEKLHVDEISAPIRSHLGFHIAQLTDLKPARAMSFEETRDEIASILRNEKRAAAIARLTERLGAQ